MRIAIVLWNTLNEDNSPSGELLVRLNKIVEIYKNTIDKVIFMLTKKPSKTEASVMWEFNE